MAAIFVKGGGGGASGGCSVRRGPTIPSSAGSNMQAVTETYTMDKDANFYVMVGRPNRNTSDTVRVTVYVSGVQVDRFTLPTGGNQYRIESYPVQKTNIVNVELYSTGNCGPQMFVAADQDNAFV